MMNEALLDIAVDLTRDLSTQDRYQRLLGAVRRVLPCDASALLKYENGMLIPVAVDGLAPETLWRRFDPSKHPRFEKILASEYPVRFPMDSELPDPYDGLVSGHEGKLEVHACMGCSLKVDDQLVGILTLDGLTPGMFDGVDDQTMSTYSALAAAAMRTALLIEGLEKRAKQKNLLAQELVNEALKRDGGELIGQSPVMQHLAKEIELVAASDLSVLITGETGVGKELVARTIHNQSNCADQPLIYINCAALPESIAESELFGHTKGAFTGATSDRGGKFELADGGTLFLDEIGELSLALQAKMLRVLQSGEIQRVGSDKTKYVEVRILAATNRDLEAEVEAGNFRRDLYHRLSVFPIEVPPLRLRQGDIVLLAGYFMEKMRTKLGLKNLCIASAAMALLEAYSWPGNVRELEHVISRAALRAKSEHQSGLATIQPMHCDIRNENDASHQVSDRHPPQEIESVSNETINISMNDSISAFQSTLIKERLEACDYNWSQAAKSLGMDRGNLHRMAKRLKIK
jgi:anaerobic nitric oxide reductase transcription regulator